MRHVCRVFKKEADAFADIFFKELLDDVILHLFQQVIKVGVMEIESLPVDGGARRQFLNCNVLVVHLVDHFAEIILNEVPYNC